MYIHREGVYEFIAQHDTVCVTVNCLYQTMIKKIVSVMMGTVLSVQCS